MVRYQVRVGPELSLTAEVHDPDFAGLKSVGDTVTLWCGAEKVRLLTADS